MLQSGSYFNCFFGIFLIGKYTLGSFLRSGNVVLLNRNQTGQEV